MENTFYYADLDLTVTLKEGNTLILKCLTPNESLSLSNQLYLAISGFLTNRALYMADTVETLERITNAGKKDSDITKGG